MYLSGHLVTGAMIRNKMHKHPVLTEVYEERLSSVFMIRLAAKGDSRKSGHFSISK